MESYNYVLPLMNLNQLQKLCLRLKKALTPIQKELFARKFSYLCSNIIDQNQFGVAGNFFNIIDIHQKTRQSFLPYTEVMSIFMEYQKNEDRAPGYNFKMDIVFFPMRDKIFVQIISPMFSEYETIISQFPFKKHSYNIGKSYDTGFTFSILNNDTLIESDLVIKYQPSVETRAQALIIDLIYQEEVKLIQINDPTFTGGISLYLNIKNRIVTGDLPVANRIQDLAKKIKPLTNDMLTTIHVVNPFLSLVDR